MNTTNTAPAGNNQKQEKSLYPNQPGFKPQQPVIVGGEILRNDPIEYNIGRKTAKLTVRNTGDRPIQVGSHFHFFEVNRYLEFDRNAAFGCHLNIPSTTAIRFEPGDQKQVEVVTYSGKRRVIGFNGLVMGYTGDEDAPTYFPARMKALRRARKAGFRNSEQTEGEGARPTDRQQNSSAAGQNHSTTAQNGDGADQNRDQARQGAGMHQNNNTKNQ